MFPKALNGLILLRHIVQHLGTRGQGLGLRQILDWMMFVDCYIDDDYWKTEFESVVSEAGLKTTAITFTRMCQLYLGLKEENLTWCMEADTELCEKWLDNIMKMGNFGRRTLEENRGVNVFLRNRNIFAFFKSLQKLGLEHWERAYTHPALRPFAWIYQIGLYVKQTFSRKNPIRSLRSSFVKSKEKKELLDKLEIEGIRDDR